MTSLFRQITYFVHELKSGPKVWVGKRPGEFSSLNVPSGQRTEAGFGFCLG
jgi:hypothetical protein